MPIQMKAMRVGQRPKVYWHVKILHTMAVYFKCFCGTNYQVTTVYVV